MLLDSTTTRTIIAFEHKRRPDRRKDVMRKRRGTRLTRWRQVFAIALALTAIALALALVSFTTQSTRAGTTPAAKAAMVKIGATQGLTQSNQALTAVTQQRGSVTPSGPGIGSRSSLAIALAVALLLLTGIALVQSSRFRTAMVSPALRFDRIKHSRKRILSVDSLTSQVTALSKRGQGLLATAPGGLRGVPIRC
jgi:hypothetical protein